MSNQEDIKNQVENILAKVRPYVERDGGSLDLVKIEDGVVYVRLGGACVGCFALDSTLKDGIEALILEYVEGIVEVRAV